MTEKALTVEQVGKILDLKKRTVERFCRERRIPAGKIGRHWLIAESTIDNILLGRLSIDIKSCVLRDLQRKANGEDLTFQQIAIKYQENQQATKAYVKALYEKHF